MAKKELRLAVVIYGGASLAVYMHGVTKELIKLVRASKVLHEVGAERAQAYADGPDKRPPDTEAVYYEILQAINRDDHFRVVIDVIAGASAGAINGLMLAKGLVDDAQLDAQTSLWLDDADSEQLAAERVGRYRKWYLYPFLRVLSFWLPKDIGADGETRRKLAGLVRSSWFRPPFSGERLCNIFFEGFASLAGSRRRGSTLLPPGQRLDVYASVTDLVGYPRTIRLHEGLVAREKEHAAYCQLTHTATAAGAADSDFRDDNLPALVWAARASSSYAGAFPPFRHDEMQRVMAARDLDWPGEATFLAEKLRARDGSPASRHFDPAARYFVDGGIVNNKPFGAVLDALNSRPADRQVFRRLIYIEPNPSLQDAIDPARTVGYLGTLRAALSSIPRNQPILDELNAIVAQDARAQINRRVVDAHRGRIARITAELQGIHARQALSPDLVSYLRRALEDRAEAEMGLAYDAYVQRRVLRLVDALVRSWAALGRVAVGLELTHALEQALADWWLEGADVPGAGEAGLAGARGAGGAQGAGGAGLPPDADDWRQRRQQSFLDRFDVTYRIRRLQFVIRRINQFEADRSLAPQAIEALDAFKARVYAFSERLFKLRQAEALDDTLMVRLHEAAARLPLTPAQSRELLSGLAASLGLEALDRAFDAELSAFLLGLDVERVRDGILADYVGFPFFDVLLLTPGSLEGGPDPLTPIRIERISPADVHTLEGVFGGLRSRELMGFLGFFNRSYREHDYLWGRLNAADRIVDLLAGAAGAAIENPLALKCRLFKAIIAVERPRLPGCADQLDAIDAALAGLA